MGRIAQTDLMPDFTGRSLDGGRYRILELLGAGAYGKVYRAIDLHCKSSPPKLYAIKCMNNPAPGTHNALLQEREFAHHTIVSGHPNVVGFHRYWEDGLFVYVVLDLCSGGDLFGAITEKRLFQHNGQLIKKTFVQLICALEHCHKLGIYHRDIKPENVLCSNDGTNVRLADFGLSSINKTSSDFGCGSSYYMSPECIGRQSSNEEEIPYSTAENDVWALGVILTNMVTGRNPWRYAVPQDDCYVAFTKDRDFLKRVLPISSGVNSILKKVFTVQPSRRITLSALKEEVLRLESFFGDEEKQSTELESSIPTRNPSRPTLPSHGSEVINTNVSSPDFEDDCIIVEIEHGSVSTRPSSVLHPPNSKVITKNFTLVGSDDTNSAPSTSSSSSSSESEGPITPETHPVVDDPAVDIPDISGEGLGPAADFAGVQPLVITKERIVSPQKSRRPADILRSAVQRIKILSKGEAYA